MLRTWSSCRHLVCCANTMLKSLSATDGSYGIYLCLLQNKIHNACIHTKMHVHNSAKTHRERCYWTLLWPLRVRTVLVLKERSYRIARMPSVLVPSVPWHCWLGGRKGIRPVKNWVVGVLVWLFVWSDVQICIWPSWCHCHSLSLSSVKSRLVLPFWYWLAWVVPDKGPLIGCVCVIPCCANKTQVNWLN